MAMDYHKQRYKTAERELTLQNIQILGRKAKLLNISIEEHSSYT